MDRRRTKYIRNTGNANQPPWEQIQLLRLLCALILFLTVFLGKKIYPETICRVGGEVLTVLGQNTDLQGVFAQLGDSLHQEYGVIQELEDFCVEVFGPRSAPEEVPDLSISAPVSPVGLLQEQMTEGSFSHLPLSAASTANTEPEPNSAAVPAVGTVLVFGPSQDLPAGYTMDQLSFGSLQTAVPVSGSLTSPFGYRNHPISGKHHFHGGVDIGADSGTEICAFASGRVDYVGEDDSYGLYFQLDHGNGIKSFYAHCADVCVKKGQTVTVGEHVARVGASGNATGPHLHLELKCGSLRVDPGYYLQFPESA